MTDTLMHSPSPDPRRLFVYGTLRAGETGEMAVLLHRLSRHLGAGTIRAGLYAMAGYSVAAPCDEPDAVVHGDVFELHPEAVKPLLAGLDAYEGDGYRRVEVEVTMADETSVGAEAYLCAASVAGLRRIVHGDWRRERESGGGAPLANPAKTS